MSDMKTVEEIVAETKEALEHMGQKLARDPRAARAFLKRIGVIRPREGSTRTTKVRRSAKS